LPEIDFHPRGEIDMQLAGIASASSTPRLLNPVLAARSAKPSSSAAQPAAAAASSASASANSTPAAPARTSQAHGGGGGGGGGSSAASETETLVSGYSTTVAGKQYSGSVEQSGSTYTASVSGLTGATASGSTLTAAENALNIRIDELV